MIPVQKSILEILSEEKFEFKRTCHCDGFETYIYQNRELEVRYRKYRGEFSIFRYRSVAHGWDKVKNFQTVIAKYVAISK